MVVARGQHSLKYATVMYDVKKEEDTLGQKRFLTWIIP